MSNMHLLIDGGRIQKESFISDTSDFFYGDGGTLGYWDNNKKKKKKNLENTPSLSATTKYSISDAYIPKAGSQMPSGGGTSNGSSVGGSHYTRRWP